LEGSVRKRKPMVVRVFLPKPIGFSFFRGLQDVSVTGQGCRKIGTAF
jgi:hypothetical protein